MMQFRNKGGQQTTNLCNSFLVTYLERKKRHCEKIGMERKSFVYLNAIKSVKKYPLPIISQLQLKALQGVGENLGEEMVAVIKEHYKNYLRGKEMKGFEEKYQERNDDLNQQNSQSLGACKSTGFARHVGQKKQGTQAQQNENEDDTLSMASFKSANTSRPYKPRPRTQGAYVLLTINKYAEQETIQIELLRKKLKEDYSLKITPKSLILTLSNLSKAGYISQQIGQSTTLLQLTAKGISQVGNIQAKTVEKDSSVRVKSVLNSFLSNNQPKSQSVQSLPSKKAKRIVSYDEEIDLVLLIDTRQMKDKQQQSFFQKRLTQKYNVKTKTCNLPIGDFMWQYNNKILDYVLERKKADDLISSIQDGRYKQQKYRLKNSGFSHIYYLFQGHLTGANAKYERSVSGALLNTRVMDKFKVVEVNNVTESLKFIQFVTQQILKKIGLEQSIATLGTLEEVSAMNGKACQLTVEHIFGLGLKTIPGVGRSAISEVLKHFRSFRQLYDQLLQLETQFERTEFLRHLLRGSNVRSSLPQLLVSVLFGNAIN